MTNEADKLDTIEISEPCTISWDDMHGDERIRHCTQCKLNVYNISSMTVQEANEMIASSEGQICVRMYQRSDGTVLTADCSKEKQQSKGPFNKLLSQVRAWDSSNYENGGFVTLGSIKRSNDSDE